MTDKTKELPVTTGVTLTKEAREHIASIADMLARRGMQVSSTSAVIRYALARVVMTECAADAPVEQVA